MAIKPPMVPQVCLTDNSMEHEGGTMDREDQEEIEARADAGIKSGSITAKVIPHFDATEIKVLCLDLRALRDERDELREDYQAMVDKHFLTKGRADAMADAVETLASWMDPMPEDLEKALAAYRPQV